MQREGLLTLERKGQEGSCIFSSDVWTLGQFLEKCLGLACGAIVSLVQSFPDLS